MKKRIFAAIEIPESVKEKVSDYIKILKTDFSDAQIRWEKTEKIHLTLKFFGEIGDEEFLNLENAFEKVSKQIPKFSIAVADTGVFPNARKARIFRLGVKDKSGNLSKLNLILESELEKYGFEKEARKFKPHLTIARLREPQTSKDLSEAHLKKSFEPVEFEATEISIFQSVLQPTGSVYNKIGRFGLVE